MDSFTPSEKFDKFSVLIGDILTKKDAKKNDLNVLHVIWLQEIECPGKNVCPKKRLAAIITVIVYLEKPAT